MSSNQQIAPVHVLDMASDVASMNNAFGRALQDTGFVMTTNTPISTELVDRCYEMAVRVFDLSQDQLLRYMAEDGQVGFYPIGGKKKPDIADPTAKVPDAKEFWMVRLPEGPRANVWPTEVPQFRDAFEQLYREFNGFARILFGMLEQYIGVPAGTLLDGYTGVETVVRVLHYPPCEVNVVRSKAHLDICTIAALAEERIRYAPGGPLFKRERTGLELLRGDTAMWESLIQVPGSFVVDAGRMCDEFTGYHSPDRHIRATKHRVFAHTEEPERYMIVCFIHLDPDQIVRWVDGKPVTAGMTLERMLREVGYK